MVDALMERLDTHGALEAIFSYIKLANKYVNDKEPWKLKGAELGNVIYNLLEALRIISILVSPFMPGSSEKINAQIGAEPGRLGDCAFRPFNGRVVKGEYLFRKIL